MIQPPSPPPFFRELPEHLRERLRPLNSNPVRGDGDFVLYWCHHALRASENPALDIAVWTANRLGLPVLVYQGLSGRHRFNSDRHYAFILESARDLAAELQNRKIRHVLFLGNDPGRKGPLAALARRAAVMVSEDFPAPPFPVWNQNWAEKAETLFCLVDTACVVPMQLLGKAFARAYEFRNATAQEYPPRLAFMWPPISAQQGFFEGDPGFQPVDWTASRIEDLLAKCAIDHSVGPVSGTRGGARAGYARWKSFQQHGLRDYARLRNDAAIEPPRGVSRLSPYLHYGCVSPLRIARDAASQRGRGPDKFLDELLIWRELAHNFCFHCPNPESLEALPSWARQSLLEHARDERDALYTWEQLARAQTADPLWNAAQRSLLVHGELHNNLRMTWGKAFLRWTRSPSEALRLMIDLNHRYALDGSDPNSYGGLLWCLGLFDRPFQDQPVVGRTRSRPASAHARRLDLDRYSARVSRPSSTSPGQAAVIGGGIAGLAAARVLNDHRIEVTVFDKGRSVGGRTCSRRLGPVSFDHGAQYFTVRNPTFARYVESWRQLGVVEPWNGRIVSLRAGRISETSGRTRYVGTPSMSAVAKRLAERLKVFSETTVDSLRRRGDLWEVASENQSLGEFDTVILALPAPQARLLLPEESNLKSALGKVKFSPCWALMLSVESPVPVAFDGAFVQDSALGWIARNSSKPGRASDESWVLHANPEWSAAHLERSREEVEKTLTAEFLRVAGLNDLRPVDSSLQRWRYALPAEIEGPECHWDRRLGIAVCGDWCRGGRIESAFLSGLAAAGRVLGRSFDENREWQALQE